ncbi:hypothetical protein AB0D45_07350 [Streptomyces sp. NPDC048352]|uniref:hypothetical protein n=1 Tax=Streptomyces sp. NPDC048352 TaxID=3154718 RepID=UPI003437C818
MTENPVAHDAPAAAARDRRAFLAPLLSTLLTLPMALLALFYAGMSPMACDSCDGEAAAAFDAGFETAWPVFLGALVVALLLLAACWILPWERRNAARRVLLALAAPGAVLLGTVVFTALIDWP